MQGVVEVSWIAQSVLTARLELWYTFSRFLGQFPSLTVVIFGCTIPFDTFDGFFIERLFPVQIPLLSL